MARGAQVPDAIECSNRCMPPHRSIVEESSDNGGPGAVLALPILRVVPRGSLSDSVPIR